METATTTDNTETHTETHTETPAAPVRRRVYLRGPRGHAKRVLVLHKGQLYQAPFAVESLDELGDGGCEILVDPEHGLALVRFPARNMVDVLTPVDN